MVIKRFEDIIAWQKAKVLILMIYKLLKNNQDYDFKRQIQRAGVSIMNNIAEGFERKGNKEFMKFLFIAKGSNAEVRSMLYLALELKYINSEDFKRLINLTIEVKKLINGLMNTLIS